MTNEELIEELLWAAYEKGLGIQLAELAGLKLQQGELDRMVAYSKAYEELGLDDN